MRDMRRQQRYRFDRFGNPYRKPEPTNLYESVTDFMEDSFRGVLFYGGCAVGYVAVTAWYIIKYAVIISLCLVGIGWLFQDSLLKNL